MKNKKIVFAVCGLLGLAPLLSGCVAVPPLIHVQHKDNNERIEKRLDSIEQRLQRIEQNSPKN